MHTVRYKEFLEKGDLERFLSNAHESSKRGSTVIGTRKRFEMNLVHKYVILRDGVRLEVEAQYVRQGPDGTVEIWTDGEVWILNGSGWSVISPPPAGCVVVDQK